MKRILLISFCLSLSIFYVTIAVAEEINKGDSKAKVLSILGEPDGYMKVGSKEYMVYGSKEVVLKEGKVIRSTVELDRAPAEPQPIPQPHPQSEPQAESQTPPWAESGGSTSTPVSEEKMDRLEFDDHDEKQKGPSSFDDVDIHNVPVAPFLSEVRGKVDITRHSAYVNMPRYEGNYRHIVDPFSFDRDRGDVPTYRYRQFTTFKTMGEIIKWYKTKASSSSGGGRGFTYGSWFSNGPFDDAAANVGVNNGRNFIQVSMMKGAGDDRISVYIFQYRTAPPPSKPKVPTWEQDVIFRTGMPVEVKMGSRWLGGKILQIDMSRDKPYYVEFTGYVDYFEWRAKDTLRPRE